MSGGSRQETVSGYRPAESVMFTPGSSSFALVDTTTTQGLPSSPRIHYHKTSSYPPAPPTAATVSEATATLIEVLSDLAYDTANTSEVSDNGNATGGYDGETLVFPEYIKVVATVFCSVVLFVGVVGNVLIPLVILKNRDMRNSTNYFLINLSLADLLVLLICLPTVLVELHSPPDVWVLGYTMCKVVPYVELSVVHASVLSLLVISLERYHVICQPLQAGYRCTRAKATIAIIIIWVVAFLSAGPILMIVQYDYVKYYDGSLRPNCITPIDEMLNKMYFVGTTVLFFFLPLFVLIAVYSVIARQLLIDTYELTHKKENPQMRARRQVVVMLATVVVSFFVCLMPMRILYLWIIAVPSDTIEWLGIEGYFNILYFCRVMHYINSSINPILYNMTSTKFRTAFQRVFCRRGRRGSRGGLHRQDTYSNTSYNNHTVTNNVRLHYGTNCSLVYKTMYTKSVLSHQYSCTSTGSGQVTRHTSLVSSTGSNRPSTRDSFV